MARHWTCRKCKARWPRTRQKCATLECSGKRPPASRPKHMAALDQPYEWWADRFGERCGICGREPSGRRLDRDHDHATGEPRGLLCFKCNRNLPNFVDAGWLRAALEYVEREQAA